MVITKVKSINIPKREPPGRFQESTYLLRNSLGIQEPIEGFFKSQEQA